MTKIMHRFLALASIVVVVVAGAFPATAQDRANVPLKNWGGFAVSRDAVYDDLERLVAAGLTDRTLLSTKPLSRTEAARIVGRAVATIRGDKTGRYNGRADLDAALDRLLEEFRVELAELGIKLTNEPTPLPGAIRFLPVDRAQVRFGAATHGMSLVNSQGLRVQDGVSAGATFESRAQVGDWLTFYLQPEVLGNQEFGAARLATGYLKLTMFNVELLVGRDSLWWGPGLHGSLVFSNNAPPLDQVRIGAAEPFLLPWVGEWIGPTKILAFLAQLEARRDHPRAKLAGMRGTIAPFPFLELGISRAVQFDGTDRPRPAASDYPRILFDPPAGDDPAQPEFRSNNVFAIDAELRIPNIERYLRLARDLRLYGEFGWDDTCCSTAIVPLRDAISGLIGAHFIGVLGQDGLEARFEYAETSRLSFVHHQFVNGYWTRGESIAHFIGNEGRDFLARATNWLAPNLLLGVQLNRAVIGSTVSGFEEAQERRLGGGIDLSFRFWDKFSLFGAYQLVRVNNRDFRAGHDGYDHVFRLELTHSFR